jgi:hypothetical protein
MLMKLDDVPLPNILFRSRDDGITHTPKKYDNMYGYIMRFVWRTGQK